MKKEDYAAALYADYNCSQSVLTAFGEELGLDEDTTMKIAIAFGSGMARNQHICGALTGAMMVLGMKFGIDDEDELQKEKVYRLTNVLMDEFKSIKGTLNCRELLGFDMKTEEGKSEIKRLNLRKTICDKCVRDAVIITEKIIVENE
jgi:C_GCAxxG_C_C family probable redox protein